jgi:hypothetical protein
MSIFRSTSIKSGTLWSSLLCLKMLSNSEIFRRGRHDDRFIARSLIAEGQNMPSLVDICEGTTRWSVANETMTNCNINLTMKI